MCCKTKCKVSKMADIKRMQTTEIRLIQFMCGKTLLYNITNSVLMESIDITDEHLGEHQMR